MSFAFAIPGDIATPTGGYGYARRVLAEAGDALRHLPLPGGFPLPSDAELAQTAALLAQTRGPVLIDGLAYGALPPEVIATVPGPIVALCHHPLALETGLDPETAARLEASEKAGLALATAVIATSRTTAETLTARYAIPAGKIAIAPPGQDRAPAAPLAGDPPAILSVGAVIRRKGHDLLLTALAALRDAPWTCRIAGPLDRDPEFAARQRQRAADLGFADRVEFLGAVDTATLERLYAEADLFCLPSRHEGYGMAFTEAMAHGLPVVAARAGAAPEVIPPGCGLLAPPDDAEALADMLALVLTNPAVRRQLGAAAWKHAQTLPTWADTARTVLKVLEGVA